MKPRLRWLPVAFLLLGVAEFLVLLGMTRLIGTAAAILILAGLSLAGGVLLRSEGLRGWRRLRAARRGGGPIGDEVLDGVLGLLAALLLLIPGYLSALAGLLVFVPPVRRLLRARLRGATERRISSNVAGDFFGPRQVRVQKTRPAEPTGEAIEGEIIE